MSAGRQTAAEMYVPTLSRHIPHNASSAPWSSTPSVAFYKPRFISLAS